MKTTILLPVLFVCFTLAGCGPAPVEDMLVFSYFIGNGEDGLHLCISDDGLVWEPVNEGESLLAPAVGEQRLMRDPCILRGPDSIFRMVWTTGWEGRTIGYASSEDLVHWSEQRALPVMAHEPDAMNCWAPEVIYDENDGQYVIFWSTTIPGRFPETDTTGNKGRNHRIYCTTTTDFETFTPTRLFFDPGYQCIDAAIVQDDGRYIMFFKDEVYQPEKHRYLLVTTARDLDGPWAEPFGPLTGNDCEGPSAIRIGEWWYCYYDNYSENKVFDYQLMRSKDLRQWEDLSSELRLPTGAAHGTVFRAHEEVIGKLQELAG